MGFNLYLASSMPKYIDEFLQQNGDRVLHSYALNKRDIEKRAAQGRITFVDSGAYSAHTKGITINIDEYIDFVNKYDEHISMFAQLDVIPGRLSTEEAAEQTWQNYLYMLDRVKSPNKLLPVFHRGAHISYLTKILEHTPRVEYMALGALVGVWSTERESFITQVFKVIKESSNPTIKVHAFGMTDMKLLEMFPFESADSASWKINAGNGEILTDYGYTAVSSGKVNSPKHVGKLPKEAQERFTSNIESLSVEDFNELRDSYKLRLLWNVKYFIRWADNYKRTGKKVSQNKLF